MHPLAACADAKWEEHKHPIKRRSSLDNSCLSAHETLRLLLKSKDTEDDEYESSQPRRLSLNPKSSITATFLADKKSSGHRKEADLDLDYHNSEHNASNNHNTTSMLGDEESISNESYMDSDCDSFCEASGQEQANEEYLQQDLGASCFWDMTYDDMNVEPDHEMNVPNVISEEGDDSHVADESMVALTPDEEQNTSCGPRETPSERSVTRVVSQDTSL